MLNHDVHSHRVRLQRGLAAVVLSVVLAMGTASCAGSGGSGAPTPSPSGISTSEPDPADALVKFNACLRANGVKVSDSGPSVARGDTEDPNLASAAAKCKHHLAGTSVEVATGGDGGQVSEEQLTAMLAYARCMRDHSINMPDPNPKSGAVAPKGSSGLDENSEEFQNAHTACRSHLGDVPVSEGSGS
jgi:hypothetical protein